MRVLVTEPIVDSAIEYLRKHAEVTIGKPGQFSSEEALIKALPGYDALLSMLSNPVSGNVLKSADSLKIVANYAVGYNNIDTDTARSLKIRVSNTPDVLTDATADLAFGLILGAGRKLTAAEKHIRDGNFKGWEPLGFMGLELSGSTIGIIGMGRIGQAVAKRAIGFNMKVMYHNRSRLPEETERTLNAVYIEDVKKLVAGSDIISLHCPLTPQTRHLIDSEMIALMKPHSILVNTARGPVVDEAALAEALHNGKIGGAGFDVFEEEPKVHPGLLSAPNCMILPHIGSATISAREAMGKLAAESIISVLNGKRDSEIPNLIVSF